MPGLPVDKACVVSLDTHFNYRPIALKEVEGYFGNVDTYLYALEKKSFAQNAHKYSTAFVSSFDFDVDRINAFCDMYPHLYVICGGYSVNKNPSIAATANVDLVGLGDLLSIMSDYFRSGYSTYCYEPHRVSEHLRMSEFVPMDFRKISYRKDFYVQKTHQMMIYSSRGSCPATCTFCSRYAELSRFDQYGQFRNYKRASQILDEIREIEYLKLSPGVKIAIADSDFFGNHYLVDRAKDMMEIASGDFRHGLMVWSSAESILKLPIQFLESFFRKLNVVECRIGIENFSDRSLREFSRGWKTLEKNLSVYHLDTQSSMKLPFRFSFLFFTPFTEPQDILDSLKVIGDRKYFNARLSPIDAWRNIDQAAFLYHGTAMYQQYISSGLPYESDPYGNIVTWEFSNPLTSRVYDFVQDVKGALAKPSYAMCGLINKHNDDSQTDPLTLRGDQKTDEGTKVLPGCLVCPKSLYGGREFSYRIVERVLLSLEELISNGFDQESYDEHLRSIYSVALDRFEDVRDTIGIDINLRPKNHHVDLSKQKEPGFDLDWGHGVSSKLMIDKMSMKGHADGYDNSSCIAP